MSKEQAYNKYLTQYNLNPHKLRTPPPPPDDILRLLEPYEKQAVWNIPYLSRPDIIFLNDVANNIIRKHNIGRDHGIEHAHNVAYFAGVIIRHMRITRQLDWSDEQSKLAVVTAFLHDCVDEKFGAEVNISTLKQAIQKKFGFGDYEVKLFEYTVTNMSFSKRRKNRSSGRPEFNTADNTEVQYCQIVSDADLLDAYNPERANVYQRGVFGKIDEPPEVINYLVYSWNRTILEKRVMLYLEHFICTDAARQIALPLHDALADYVHHFQDYDLMDY